MTACALRANSNRKNKRRENLRTFFLYQLVQPFQAKRKFLQKVFSRDPAFWLEVRLLHIRPIRMDADVPTVTKVLTRMKKNGKAIIGMKVYGCGQLLDKKDECLQFQTGSGLIDSFTMGLESIEQLKDIQKRLPEASIRA